MEKNQLLRSLPKVDEILKDPAVAGLPLPAALVTELVRHELAAVADAQHRLFLCNK